MGKKNPLQIKTKTHSVRAFYFQEQVVNELTCKKILKNVVFVLAVMFVIVLLSYYRISRGVTNFVNISAISTM